MPKVALEAERTVVELCDLNGKPYAVVELTGENEEKGLGKIQTLMVVKKVEFGVYLGTEKERVLLPKKQVPKDIEVGDPIEVFLYKDSSDRLIATTKHPKIVLGELKVLKVADTGKVGAFLDWGLEKVFCFLLKNRQPR